MADEGNEEVFSSNRFYQGAWIVYLNGLEVPIISGKVEFGVGKIPTASIGMVPDIALQRLGYEDRMQVAIFYLDEFRRPNNPHFCLLGEFEVTGWGYVNTGVSRFIQIDCTGHLQILQQLRLLYMAGVDDIVNALSPVEATDASSFHTPIITYPYSLFLQGLAPVMGGLGPVEETEAPPGPVVEAGEDWNKVPKDQFITRPIEFVKNVMTSLTAPITGDPNAGKDVAKIPHDSTSVPGRNFFRRWINMTDFNRRWVALPLMEDTDSAPCFPLLQAVQNYETAQAAMQQQIGQAVGSVGSVHDVLSMVLDTMFMELSSIPSPPAVSVDSKTWCIAGGINGRNESGGKEGRIATNFLKPSCFFGIPPLCNTIFPSMISSISFQEAYMNQPTRVYLGEKFISDFLAGGKNIGELSGQLLSTGYPPIVDQRMKELVTDPKASTKNFLIWPEEFYKGPVSRHVSAPPWLWFLQQLYVSKMAETAAAAAENNTNSGGGGDDITGEETVDGVAVDENTQTGTTSLTHVYVEGKGIIDITAIDVNVDRGVYLIALAAANAAAYGRPEDFDFVAILYGSSFEEQTAAKAYATRCKANNTTPDWLEYAKKKASVQDLLINTRAGMEQWLKSPGDPSGWSSLPNKGKGELANTTQNADVIKEVQPYILKSQEKWQKLANISGDKWTAFINATMRKESNYNKGKGVVNDKHVASGQQAVGLMAILGGDARKWIASGKYNPDLTGGLGELFKLYAQYEYFRSRYAERNATVSMAFNPYIVPGFTSTVFDQREPSGLDFIGYVTGVRHSFNSDGKASSCSTDVTLSFVRTIQEYGAEKTVVSAEQTESGEGPTFTLTEAFPPEPIPEVLRTFQLPAMADKLYNRLFYNDKNKGASAFSLNEHVTSVTYSGKDIDKEFEYQKVKVIPKPNKSVYFENYTKAMQYISRPVCSINNYISLRAGLSITAGMPGARQEAFFSSLRAAAGGALYYSRLFKLKQGPGEEPDIKYTNKNTSIPWEQVPITAYPMTRSNWDTYLQHYRVMILGDKGLEQ